MRYVQDVLRERTWFFDGKLSVDRMRQTLKDPKDLKLKYGGKSESTPAARSLSDAPFRDSISPSASISALLYGCIAWDEIPHKHCCINSLLSVLHSTSLWFSLLLQKAFPWLWLFHPQKIQTRCLTKLHYHKNHACYYYMVWNSLLALLALK